MQIPMDFYEGFFEDFFFNFSNERCDVDVNRSKNFISSNVDPQSTSATSIRMFLHDLFYNILTERLSNYETQFLVIEKNTKIGLFKTEHQLMPECLIIVLNHCSRDEQYKTIKYTLINFMYSIINDY